MVGDSPIFEIEYSNLEQRSIFSKKSTHFMLGLNRGWKPQTATAVKSLISPYSDEATGFRKEESHCAQ